LPPTTVPDGPVTALLLGDSTAVALADGLFQWAQVRPEQLQVASLARLGCGMVRNSNMSGDDGGFFAKGCEQGLGVELPQLLAAQVPDVAMVMVTIPDTGGRKWTDAEGVLLPHDERYATRMMSDYEALAATLAGAGVRHVLWVVPPRPTRAGMQAKVEPIADRDWQPMVDAIEGVAVRWPGVVQVVRLDEWMARYEPTDDSWRPDGLHLELPAAVEVSNRYVGPLLIETGSR
jgi:hypothetical protein